jgi:hypothetical protein
LPDRFSARRRSIRSIARFSGRIWPPNQAPSISAVRPSPPMPSAFVPDAIASRSLCARTKAVLYWTSMSRAKASMILPFTSLQNTAIAIRQVLSGILCQANRVPDVTEKSAPQALQRQRG